MLPETVPLNIPVAGEQKIPDWWSEVKAEGEQRVGKSELVRGCRIGSLLYIKALIVIFWKFVDEFPAILAARFSEMPDRIIQRLAKPLSGITKDEKSHRKMWLKTASSIGVTQEILQQRRENFPKVTHLCNLLSEETDTFTTFCRIVAVEIVAEALSRHLLGSHLFCAVLAEDAKVWFKVHIVHEAGTTHEMLALKLALRSISGQFKDDEERRKVEHAVLEIVDAFVDASNEVKPIAIQLALAA